MYKIIIDDCIHAMSGMDANSIDTVITDPPAGINFMAKQWDLIREHDPKTLTAQRAAPILQSLREIGLLQGWEAGFLLFTVDWASAALRVAKPGATALVWALPRTSDLTKMGLRMAGWQIRDTIYHLFAQGFPKSHNIGKAVDRAKGATRKVVGQRGGRYKYAGTDIRGGNFGAGTSTPGKMSGLGNITAPATPEAAMWEGWGTALKPAAEEWIMAIKPVEGRIVDNALKWGVAGLNIDGARIDNVGEETGRNNKTSPYASRRTWSTSETPGVDSTGRDLGRWPANVTHDGSDEVLSLFPDSSSGALLPHHKISASENRAMSGKNYERHASFPASSGSTARFFFCSKPKAKERNAGLEGMPMGKRDETRREGQAGGDNPYNRGARLRTNYHPTVKPVTLMRHFCALTKTPTGGLVLDPFLGSGSTAVAAMYEGRDIVGIEQDPGHAAIAEARTAYAESIVEGVMQVVVDTTSSDDLEDLPIFGNVGSPVE